MAKRAVFTFLTFLLLSACGAGAADGVGQASPREADSPGVSQEAALQGASAAEPAAGGGMSSAGGAEPAREETSAAAQDEPSQGEPSEAQPAHERHVSGTAASDGAAGSESAQEKAGGEEKEAAREEPAREQTIGGEPARPGEPAAEPQPQSYRVEIVNFAFTPQVLEIEAGSSVEFVNLDDVPHTATGNNGEFDTGYLAKGESKTVVFEQAGEYGYYCIPHPGMRGTIIVK